MGIQYTKLQKWFVSFGMISVISFFTHTILGNILWKGYNPIRQTISELTADGAPNAQLLRILVGVYEVCFLIFMVGMIIIAINRHQLSIKIGYFLLLLTAIISIIGFNTFPMSIALIVSIQNLAHILVTIILLCSTILTVTLISIGYLKTEKFKALGRISLFAAIVSSFFSLVFWYADFHGYNNIGLLERLTIYPFHMFTFIVSWYYFRYLKAKD